MSNDCAWCLEEQGENSEGSHGICDAHMVSVFGIDPASIHAEIEAEEEQEAA